MSFESLWRDLAPLGRTAAGGYRRQPFTEVDRELRAWFVEAALHRGLVVEQDRWGNLRAWWRTPDQDLTQGVLTGSHVDSVVDGGAFDGPLGVVSALAALDLMRERGVQPRRPLGIGVFVEEEGSRFPVACVGSRLATGQLSWEAAAQLRDRDGVWLPDALAAAGIHGDDPELPLPAHFVELHVEQGRQLVHHDAAVGLASEIWPHGRYRWEFTGQANHAGTTAMEDRHDPMQTYAVTALAAAKLARLQGQRATFGRVQVEPNGTNAVPSRVTAWLDLRCDDPATQATLLRALTHHAEERALRDGTTVAVHAESESHAVHFDEGLRERLAASYGWPVLPTQAGHDAGILAQAGVPTAMLFVRNPTGVSHAPDEHAELADCLVGVAALADVLTDLVGATND